MPNHVTTQVVLSPEAARALTREPTAEEREANEKERGSAWHKELASRLVDFGEVVPPPPNLETGDCTGQHAPGVVCWYEWQSRAWGTKWNAYDQTEPEPQPGDLVSLRFDSAWSHPLPVIKALAARFPEDPIYVRYADEDLGSNMAAYVAFGDDATLLISEDDGTLPEVIRDWIAQHDGVDATRCVDWASPVPYGSGRTEAQNDRATDWASRFKYGQTVQEMNASDEAWGRAYHEAVEKFGDSHAEGAQAWLGARNQEIYDEIVAALPAHQRLESLPAEPAEAAS